MADPQLYIVVKLQATQKQLCFMDAATSAAEVFKTSARRAKCQEGTLQDASGKDLAENQTELPAGVYIFTPVESTGM